MYACANWPGNWRKPILTSVWRPLSSMSRVLAPRSGPSRVCRCCTWIIQSSRERVRLIKTAFDRVFAATALVLLSPLFVILCVIIRCSDGGPAFFRQVRVGKDGRPFILFKFRTMVPDAEVAEGQLAALNETDAVLFKIRNDPRITRVGSWLRRWSLDELPQLINVLRGDMSLVGPRPALPEEAALYRDHVRRRLVVRPGLTGLWQVNGRADLSWEESVRLDLRYVENWSFVLDLQILWKTLSAVLRGSGAY